MDLRGIFGLGALGGAAVFAYLAYEMHFKWRGCFDENGRCFDEATGVVYDQMGGFLWYGPALICISLAAALLVKPRGQDGG